MAALQTSCSLRASHTTVLSHLVNHFFKTAFRQTRVVFISVPLPAVLVSIDKTFLISFFYLFVPFINMVATLIIFI